MRYQLKGVREEMTARNELGCAGMYIIDGSNNTEVLEHRKKLFGCEDEDPIVQALSAIADNIMAAASCEEDSTEDDDVGVVVTASNSDAMEYGAMISDIMSARTLSDLQEIAEVYHGMPGAEELAAACAAKFSSEARIVLVS